MNTNRIPLDCLSIGGNVGCDVCGPQLRNKPMSTNDKLTAAVRRCDICGTINACDLDATPRRIKDMQMPDHTVTQCTESEAMELWKSAARCDHKAYIAELRAQICASAKNQNRP